MEPKAFSSYHKVALPTVIYILHRRRKFINRILSWAYPLSDILSFAHNILPNA